FALSWLLLHARSFGAPDAPPLESRLEEWRNAGNKEGIAARERLREGVESALLALGNGFLAEDRNAALAGLLTGGELRMADFFNQLLRLVYRLIFLLAAEDRALLHAPDASRAAKDLYAVGYSVGRLRERAVRRAARDQHAELWQGLLVTFAALARGETRLGLPALGGLFERDMIPSFEAVRLANRPLMEAMFRLAWLREGGALVPVNWRDMQTEELGSVYESLLELTPQLADGGRRLIFAEGAEQKGNARKTTGSYYTPDALVQALLDSALDPVLDRVETEAEDPAAELLGVSVIDPACGSGHFLLSAGRRIAARLARARTGGLFSPDAYRHALRDVARACLYGVDRNPFAVELAVVALW
ncbi:MAG: N-6 DNA methylase, partial [Acetobacteraceae bacterium]